MTALLWKVLVTIAFVLMIYTLAIRLVVELLPQYRAEVERWVTATLDVPVTIDSISTQWDWLRPSLTLHNIKINSDSIEVAPELGQFRIQLNILASLLALEPKLGHFDLTGLKFVVEKKQEKTRLVGLPAETRGKIANHEVVTAQIWQVINSLLDQKSINIKNYYVAYLSEGELLTIKGDELLLAKHQERYSFSTVLSLTREETLRLSLVADINTDARQLSELEGELYIALEQGDLGKWLPKMAVGRIALSELQSSSRLWVSMKEGELNRIELDLATKNLVLENTDTQQTQTFDQISGKIVLYRNNHQSVHLEKNDGKPSGIETVETPSGLKMSAASPIAIPMATLKDRKRVDVRWDVNVRDLRMTHQGVEYPAIDSHGYFFERSRNASFWLSQIPLEPIGLMNDFLQLDPDGDFGGDSSDKSEQQLHLLGRIKNVSLTRNNKQFSAVGDLEEVGLKLTQVGHAHSDKKPISLKSKQQKNQQKASRQSPKGTQTLIENKKVPASIPDDILFSVTGINGQVHVDNDKGAMILNAKNMILELPKLYDWPLKISQLSGPVMLERTQQGIVLQTGNLIVENDDASGHLMFSLDLPLKNNHVSATKKEAVQQYDETEYEAQLHMMASLNQGNGDQTWTYLPKSLVPSLHQWLLDGDIKGQLRQGDFLFHGPLKFSPAEPHRRTFQMRFFVNAGQLTYHPDWPRLSELETEILITNGETHASVYQGKVGQSELQSGTVYFPKTALSEPSAVMVRAAAKADLKEALKVLTESPVRENLPESIQNSTGSGPVELSLDIDLPMIPGKKDWALMQQLDLKPKKVPFPTTLSLVADVKNSQFSLPSLDLTLKKVNGRLTYDSTRGLNSTGLSADLLGNTVGAHIQSAHHPVQDEWTEKQFLIPDMPKWKSTKMYITGDMSIEALRQWQDISWLYYADGVAPFNAELHFGYGGDALVGDHHLEVHTNLKGVEIDFPEPLKKLKAEPLHLFYRMSLGQKKPYMSLQFSDQLSIALAFSGAEEPSSLALAPDEISDVTASQMGDLERAKIHFGDGSAKLPNKPGILINGRLEEVVLEEWLDAFRSNHDSTANGGQSFIDQLRWLDLNIGQLDVFGILFPDFSGQLMRIEDHWNFAFQNKDVAALAKIPEPIVNGLLRGDISGDLVSNPWTKYTKPVTADIQYLYLPFKNRTDSESVRSGPATTADYFNPNYLPLMQVDIKRLFVDNEDWGVWKAWLKPVNNGVEITRLSGASHEVNFDLSGQWRLENQVKSVPPKDQRFPKEEGARIDESEATLLVPKLVTEFAPTISTHLVGRFEATNVADVLSSWGFTPSMTSRNGLMDVSLNWRGAPWDFEFGEMNGDLSLNIEDGELLDVDSATSSVRVIGLLNIHTLQRRLQLDFSDLFNKGLAYDHIRGAFTATKGVLSTPELKVEGPSAQFEIAGNTDLVNQKIDHTLSVTLPVSRNLVLPAAAAGGFPLAATAYLVERALGDQLDKLTTFKMKATGRWEDPKVTPINTNNSVTQFDDDE